MMSEMVERVARALWTDAAQRESAASEWIGMLSIDRECYFRAARAAIEAMREPTDDMIEAADAVGDDVSWARPEIAWSAMIDASLSPSKPQGGD